MSDYPWAEAGAPPPPPSEDDMYAAYERVFWARRDAGEVLKLAQQSGDEGAIEAATRRRRDAHAAERRMHRIIWGASDE